jgi:hypothetical protein
MKTMSIPAYYRDKKGSEEARAYLENLTSQIIEAILTGSTSQNLNKLVSELFSIEFKPKFLDDTKFVVVSRYHVAITAMQIWQYKHMANQSHELLHSATIRKVEDFLTHTYLPYCKSLQEGLFHKYSNHGALALMGECIATKYLMHHSVNRQAQAYYKAKLSNCSRKFAKRVHKDILSKKRWVGEKGEFWVENLRNKKGLYYTYLHLAAMLRTMVTLMNERFAMSDKIKEDMHMAYQSYLNYFYDPESWSYMEPTKIPVLRQLQKLIFPADKFVAPRIKGKEGALMDVCANKIYPVTSPPFDSDFRYKELGPFPYSTAMLRSAHNLWELL